ncbi:Acyl-CoA thioesterase 2 [Zancudomyces culisetae]|uniref:Acyl-CoA thioesterase 2 n=1 Tax=Zancudomyces culisetae TaxID=1213189 RepID=A0A1R1PSX3_ZANCU|nr:Acyl-CoA thioesterase 2 [Zancudomyces culisetae]|eukprot:OMH84051.1 Acyl-CoA thioesterase 2 [Zancudomyces culisetae]
MYQFNDKNELSIKEAPGRVELEKRFVGQDKNGMPFSNFIDRKQPLPPRLNWWFKPTGDMKDASIFDKQCAIAYISDYFYIFISLMAHDVGGIQLGDYLKFAASLDHSIWFHRPPTEWPNGNGWILHQMESTVAHGGRGHLASRLFDESGVLLASTAQEGYIMGAEKHFRGDGKVKKLSNYSFAVTH